jgi:protein involved in polysaccharide export with SLBB domain
VPAAPNLARGRGRRTAAAVVAALGLFVLAAAGTENTAAAAGTYRLFVRDLVAISVQGEPDMTVQRRIGGDGEVAVPLLGAVKLAGLTLPEAQAAIARRYVAEEIFVRPEVVISVVEYSPKEIMVLGQVGRQGKLALPPEASGMAIVEAITSAGGFTRIAKSDAVRVTRKTEDGAERTFTVDVERVLAGRGAAEAFVLQPGDVVFVPERVF